MREFSHNIRMKEICALPAAERFVARLPISKCFYARPPVAKSFYVGLPGRDHRRHAGIGSGRQRFCEAAMRKSGIQKKLYRLTYDRPDLHRKVLQIARSLEEVKKILEGAGSRKMDKGRRR